MPRAAAAHLSHSPTVACSAVDFEWQPLLVQIEKLGADGSSDEQAIAMLTQWVDRAVQALATAPTPTSPPRTSASGRPEPERPAHTASKNLASKIEEALAAIDARSSRAGSGSSDDGSVFAMTGKYTNNPHRGLIFRVPCDRLLVLYQSRKSYTASGVRA